MNCKHCNYVIEDESYDVCPSCGKSLKDEPVSEETDSIELPMKKDETSLSADDQFTANFIKKDDPLANLDKVKKESTKASSAMMISRVAALLSVLFFAGVLYYSKVVLPKVRQQIDDATREEEPQTQYTTTTKPSSSTGAIEMEASFGNESIYNQLKKIDVDFNKDITDVDITIKYPEKINGVDFSIVLRRTYEGGTYDDNISFKYGETTVSGIYRSYYSHNEDLITNFINSYVVNNINNTVVMYTKSSTFQLGNSTIILLFKDGKFDKIEKVVTTYSTDGVSIVQCPITASDNELSYCSVSSNFEKGKEVEIHKTVKPYEGTEITTETLIGLVSK